MTIFAMIFTVLVLSCVVPLIVYFVWNKYTENGKRCGDNKDYLMIIVPGVVWVALNFIGGKVKTLSNIIEVVLLQALLLMAVYVVINLRGHRIRGYDWKYGLTIMVAITVLMFYIIPALPE